MGHKPIAAPHVDDKACGILGLDSTLHALLARRPSCTRTRQLNCNAVVKKVLHDFESVLCLSSERSVCGQVRRILVGRALEQPDASYEMHE
jgi:hypothetical protein